MHRVLALSALLAASLALLPIMPAQAGDTALRWAADVPMEDCDGTPCVEARISVGPVGRVVIDTGNVSSVIDSSNVPPRPLLGLFEKSAHQKYTADVEIGGATLREVPFTPFVLNEYIAKGEMPRARATLAYTAFKDRIVQLDFVEGRVRISPVLSEALTCRQPCAALHPIPFGTKGPPILVADGFSANGKPLTAQIDTMYTGGLLVYTASIAKLGFAELAATDHAEDFPYTDGGVRMRVAKEAASIAFAGTQLLPRASLYFPTPGVHEPDGLFDGTAGLDILRNAIVTLDFRAMTVSIVPAKS